MKSIKKYVATTLTVALLSFGMTSVCHALFFNTKVKVDASKTITNTQKAGGNAYNGSYNRTNSNDIKGDANHAVIVGTGGYKLENNGHTTVSGNTNIGSSTSSGRRGIAQNAGNKIGDLSGIGNTANSGLTVIMGDNISKNIDMSDHSKGK